MNFDELKHNIPGAIESEWHKHKNGGGWVKNTVNISVNVFIGLKAIVFGGTIRGGTIWGGTIRGGTIRGGTIWDGTIRGGTIFGGTIFGGTIRGGTIWDGTIRGGTIRGGTIFGGTIWDGTIRGGTIRGGTIWGGIWKYSPLFIQGSRWSVNVSAYGKINIGCTCFTVKEWLGKLGKEQATLEEATKKEVIEYRMLVKVAARWMKMKGVDKPE